LTTIKSKQSQIDHHNADAIKAATAKADTDIRKGWTQYELDGLFQREMTDGKTILPIWHKITKDEVQAFSPTLAGRKALNTAMLSAVEIAEELIGLLPPIDSDDSTEDMEEQDNA
jgi:hypothetical protein